MRLITFINENISDFLPKAKRDIKRHRQKLESIEFIDLEYFCSNFNKLYTKEKINMMVDEAIDKIDFDFWLNGTVDIHIPKDTKINETFWNQVVKKIAKAREKWKHIRKMEDFQWLVHLPVKNFLYHEMETRAFDAVIEEEDEKFSYTKSLYYDIFGTGKDYNRFLQLMKDYKENKIPKPRSRRIG